VVQTAREIDNEKFEPTPREYCNIPSHSPAEPSMSTRCHSLSQIFLQEITGTANGTAYWLEAPRRTWGVSSGPRSRRGRGRSRRCCRGCGGQFHAAHPERALRSNRHRHSANNDYEVRVNLTDSSTGRGSSSDAYLCAKRGTQQPHDITTVEHHRPATSATLAPMPGLELTAMPRSVKPSRTSLRPGQISRRPRASPSLSAVNITRKRAKVAWLRRCRAGH